MSVTFVAPWLISYRRVLLFAKPYRLQILLLGALVVLTTLVHALPTMIVGVAVDAVGAHPSAPAEAPGSSVPIAPATKQIVAIISAHWFPERNPALVTCFSLAAIFLLLHLLSNSVGTAQDFLIARLGNNIIFDLRNKLYQHIQRLSLSYFHNTKTGDIISRVMSDVGLLEQAVLEYLLTFATNVFSFLWVVCLCLPINGRLTLVSISLTPVLIVASQVFGRLTHKTYRKLRNEAGELTAQLQENIAGIQEIQGFVREGHEQQRFEQKNRENMMLNIRGRLLLAMLGASTHLLMALGFVLILCYGGYLMVKGTLSPGGFVVFFVFQSQLFQPARQIATLYNQIQRAAASAGRVFELLDTQPEIADSRDSVILSKVHGEVNCRDVYFSYDGERQVLSGVNLVVEPGEMVALVGQSGAGKSTLVKLLPRFYDPTQGVILIDGQDIRRVKLASLRKQISTVAQSPVLFNDTVRNNILFGNTSATPDELVHAAMAANAHGFILELPKGYETVIGERGVKLSGGQIQRIAIARTILANPRILILDEATSSVDSETERLIQEAIDRLIKDRTTFVIAHRLSTVLKANKIVVMDRGRIAEEGTHQELLSKRGIYSRLYASQFGDDANTTTQF